MKTRSRGLAFGVACACLAAGWLYAEVSAYAMQRGAIAHDTNCPEHGVRSTAG